MGAVISLNSLEKNIGVSTVALTLAEKINFFSKRSVCIVECDYESPSFAQILERGLNGLEGIDSIMGYLIGSEVNNHITDIIHSNAKKFKHSDISVIYGSRHKKNYNEQQYSNFIEILKGLYEVVILDFGNKPLFNIVTEKSDLHLFIAQANYRFFREIQRNKVDFITKKTDIVLNFYDKNISNIKSTYKNDFQGKILETLPCSSTVNNTLVNGAINIEKGSYKNSITKLAKIVMKKCDIEVVEKSSFIKRVTGQDVIRVCDVSVNDFDSKFETNRLGAILVEQGICTEEDIDKCLNIQIKNIQERKIQTI